MSHVQAVLYAAEVQNRPDIFRGQDCFEKASSLQWLEAYNFFRPYVSATFC